MSSSRLDYFSISLLLLLLIFYPDLLYRRPDAGPDALAAAVSKHKNRQWPAASAVAAVELLTGVGGARPSPETLAQTDPALAEVLVPLLCKLGADVNGPLRNGKTPMHAAAMLYDGKSLVYALLDCGAEIPEADPANPYVLTPVEIAAKRANISVLQALLLAGGRSTARAVVLAEGFAALTRIERMRAAACVRMLVAHS